MILKLEFYGVKGSKLNWLKSYLHDRKQRVVLQFVNSPNLLLDWEVVRHGVPQGSVLCPLLLSVYVSCTKSIGPLVGKNTIIYFDV